MCNNNNKNKTSNNIKQQQHNNSLRRFIAQEKSPSGGLELAKSTFWVVSKLTTVSQIDNRGCIFFFLSISFIIFALLAPAPSLFVTQIRGHIAGPTPPSPLRFVPTFFYREKGSALSSLVKLHRIVHTHAMICAFCSRFGAQDKVPGGTRTRDLDRSRFWSYLLHHRDRDVFF